MTTANVNYYTDRTVRLDNRRAGYSFSDGDTIKVGDLDMYVVRSDDTAGSFQLCNSARYGDVLTLPGEAIPAVAYRPPHPSTTAEDVMNATYAWDDGTYWHFAHASEDQHHEMALQCDPLVMGRFQREINKLLIAALSTDDATVRSQKTDAAEDLDLFAEAVCNAVAVKLYAETLGHFHRNPHDGHYRRMIQESIESVENIWKGSTNHRGKLPAIQTIIDDIEKDLTPTTTVQTRAQKAAADKAAAEKAVAEAAAPADPAPDPPAE